MPTKSCRILLVDDHADSALFLARLLKLDGHTVLVADCCSSARELAATETFDLLISDIGLPDGSGYELMRDLGDKHGLRGVALSGRATPEDVEASAKAGFLAHLSKPVTIAAVSAAIERVADCPPKR